MKATHLFAILALFSSQAIAQSEGFYIGLGGLSDNYSRIDSDSGRLNRGKIIFGEMTPDSIVGELQFIDMNFNKSTGVKGELQAKSLSYSLLFYFDSGDFIFPFIKFGYNQWSTRLYTTDSKTTTDSGSNGYYGIGAQIAIGKQWATRFEYESFSFQANDKPAKINLRSLSILYQF